MAQQPYNFGFGDQTTVQGQMPIPGQPYPGSGMAPPLTLPASGMPLPSRSTVPNMSTLPTGGQPGQGVGQSIIEQLLASIRGEENPLTTGLANAGQLAGSLANDERMNRLSKGEFSQGFDQNMLAAQTGRNQNETDALRKMAITNYLKSGGYKDNPRSIMMDGRMRELPTYGSGPRPASEGQMSSAGTLEDMLKQRLASGGSYLPQPLEGYATPGKTENISRIGGTIASGAGIINDIMRNRGK